MRWFWSKKQSHKEIHRHEVQSSIEVVQYKRKANQSVAQANRDIKKLNDLLRADGITLKIHIAQGGRHG